MIKFVPSLDITAAGNWRGTMHNVLVTGGSRGIGLAISQKDRGGRLQCDRGGAARKRRTA